MPAHPRIPDLKQQTSWFCGNAVTGLLMLGLLLLLPGGARAGRPEYMNLKPRIGLGIEVKGSLNQAGLFVASDIEPLVKPRRPKLRGELSEVDRATNTVVMFGQRILVDGETEFEDSSLAKLKSGRRAEISCRVVEETGAWSARSIRIRDVKSSDKIKGTITAMSVDGTAPDTLFIDGLAILLVEQTDLAEAMLLKDRRQRNHFRRLSVTDARGLRRGHSLAGGKMGLRVQYRHFFRQEDDYDLSSTYDSDLTITQPQVRARWFVYFNRDIRTIVDVRLHRDYVVASDLGRYHGDVELQLRQAYVLWRNVSGRDVGITVGRQKIKEPREWLWDEYLEAVRLFTYGSDRVGLQITYIDPVNPLKPKFDSWNDLYLAVELYPDKNNTVTAYLLRRWDSDEGRNREPVWWGLRYLGKPVRAARAWVDLALMRGTDKGKDLRAWAFDLGGTWRFRNTPWRPSFTAAYSFGSGDEHNTPGVDGNFRQTGYEDNSMRFGGVTSVLYYGAVLDPELSNLVVATLGGGVRPAEDISLDLFYHRYRQDWSAPEVRGSLVDPPARPNGLLTDIGWELDLVLGLRDLWGVVRATWTIGIFTPGEAYSPRQERAVLNKLNFTVEI